MADTTTYSVAGMTCGHCVGAVTDELKELGGVTDVIVDLNSGAVSSVNVTSAVPLETEAVRAAIAEAGYELVAQD
ncbi:MAG: cation transporter [Candidatus Nanopelagicales bacterium]|nr:cation transporter [Candidatus Nanopelagicales bacterium]MDZ4249557.1 cation transporter [Candidatus Nanopelagicales bacterium]